jgi:hypothetical protein
LINNNPIAAAEFFKQVLDVFINIYLVIKMTKQLKKQFLWGREEKGFSEN